MDRQRNTISLRVDLRNNKGKKAGALRKNGIIPAVLYGRDVKNVDLSVDYKTFENIFKQAGSSSLLDLEFGDRKPVKVLIQDVQRDPVSDKYIHIDFHQIKMTEKLSVEIKLKFTGESKAVKESGGILVKNLDALKIECLPQDLISELSVDISSLNTFNDIIRVKDLVLSEGIVATEDGDRVVINVQAPRTEEELKSLEEKPEEKVDEVATVEDEKKKEEGESADEEEKEDKKEDKKEKEPTVKKDKEE